MERLKLIKSKIEEALKRSPELDARRITVEADGSIVKLYGDVRSWGPERRGGASRLVCTWSHEGRKPYHNKPLIL